MTPAQQQEALRANRLLYCWWCDREIAPDHVLVTDALGRPLHASACADLSAQHDHDPNDARLAALIEEQGQPVGDEYFSGLATATVYGGVDAVLGFPAAIVWRRQDGGAEVERHVSTVHALLCLDEHRREAWDD